MRALSSIPFWPCDGRRMSLWYLSAVCRYTTPQFLTNLGKGQPIAIAQRHATRHLVTEDPIFGHQVRVAQAKFLIDEARDRCQQVLPTHRSFHPSCCLSLVVSMGHRARDCKARSRQWLARKLCKNGAFGFFD